MDSSMLASSETHEEYLARREREIASDTRFALRYCENDAAREEAIRFRLEYWRQEASSSFPRPVEPVWNFNGVFTVAFVLGAALAATFAPLFLG